MNKNKTIAGNYVSVIMPEERLFTYEDIFKAASEGYKIGKEKERFGGVYFISDFMKKLFPDWFNRYWK